MLILKIIGKCLIRLIFAIIVIIPPLVSHQSFGQNLGFQYYRVYSIIAGVGFVMFVLGFAAEPYLRNLFENSREQFLSWTLGVVKRNFFIKTLLALINLSFFVYHFPHYSNFLEPIFIVLACVFFALLHVLFILDGYNWIKSVQSEKS